MKQADLGLNLSRKKTRKREFLNEVIAGAVTMAVAGEISGRRYRCAQQERNVSMILQHRAS
jgi:hypothetical protein